MLLYQIFRCVIAQMAYAISGAQSDIINFHAQKVARKHILSISAQGLVGKTEHDRYR